MGNFRTAIVTVALVGCSPLPDAGSDMLVSGRLVDRGDTPIVGCQVSILDTERHTSTDSNGQFRLALASTTKDQTILKIACSNMPGRQISVSPNTQNLGEIKHYSKPNFIILFADDLGYGDISSYGAQQIKTPRIDQMAKEGMLFTSFYAQPVCGPARASLLTGAQPLRTAQKDNIKYQHPILHPDEITLAEQLKPLGYKSAVLGKWDLASKARRNSDPQFMPLNQGFDYFYGTPTGNLTWSDVILIENENVIEDPITHEESTTKRYAKKAMNFMHENADNPFLVYLAFNMPHTQLHASPEFLGKSARGLYGDTVEEIDHFSGVLLDELARMGLDENTYVLFTSDNGPWLYEGEDGGSAGPLRGGKVSTWEGGMRVPAIMRAPGRIAESKTFDGISSTMDIFPTFVGIAGGELPKDRVFDGEDIQPVLHGVSKGNPEKIMFFYKSNHLQAVRQGPWKLHVARPAIQPWLGRYSPNKHIAPEDDIAMPSAMLFNLENDIGETQDVAKQHPEIVERLSLLLGSARSDIGDYNYVGENMRFFDANPPAVGAIVPVEWKWKSPSIPKTIGVAASR